MGFKVVMAIRPSDKTARRRGVSFTLREADTVCGSDMSTTFTLSLLQSAMTSFSSCVLTMEVIKGFLTSRAEAGVATNTLCGVAVITSTARGVWVWGRVEEAEDVWVEGREDAVVGSEGGC